MPMTATEKILARASGKDRVQPGEIVEANVNVGMLHENVGWITIRQFGQLPRQVVPEPEKFVFILDKVPAAKGCRTCGQLPL